MARYARAGGLLVLGAGGLAAAASTTLALSEQRPTPHWIHNTLPSREEQIRRLSQGTAANPYDVLIIGGAEVLAPPRSGLLNCRAAAAAAAVRPASQAHAS